ncbi:hypothetical protein ACWCPX_34925 [Streptomyces olivaceoviridis]
MLVDYVTVGGVEVVNHARLRQYLRTVGSPLTSGADICGCETLTSEVLDPDGLPYTTPDDPLTPAEWYDPDAPESVEFAGVLLLSIDGIDDYPVERSVSTAVTGGGSIGPARVQPRQMTFTAILLGSTCCGVEYGLQFLKAALQGCTGSQCGGDCVGMYACCPGEEMTREEFNAAHRRTFRRVALTSGPKVTGRNGDGSCAGGTCSMGADIIQVEWTMTAASPFAYTDPVELLDVGLPTDTDGECIQWCVHPPGGGSLHGLPSRGVHGRGRQLRGPVVCLRGPAGAVGSGDVLLQRACRQRGGVRDRPVRSAGLDGRRRPDNGVRGQHRSAAADDLAVPEDERGRGPDV